MFRLSRGVRFSLNDLSDAQLDRAPTNSFGGFPTHSGFGQFIELQVTIKGELDPHTSYLRNIKEIDSAVRQRVIPHLSRLRAAMKARPAAGLDDLAIIVFAGLRDVWTGPTVERAQLDAVAIWLTPTLCLSVQQAEFPMSTRLSQKFEFCASHRLHNPALDDEQNRATYGKCNNPNGHGHNYELQVTLSGSPNANGLLTNLAAFEAIVSESVIARLDHKNLNVEVPEFGSVIPSVENIARVIYQILKQRLNEIGSELAAVTVWETPKTWCEYSE